MLCQYITIFNIRCTLVELLSSYDIRFSPTIQTMLDTHLILPGVNSVVTKKEVQQRLNLTGGQLELDPEMILIFRKSMTWKVLHEIFNGLQFFLEPLLPQLDFLVYFHLHNSEMFNKQLLFQINKVLPSFQQSMDASSSMNLTVDMQQSPADPAKKLKEVTDITIHTYATK